MSEQWTEKLKSYWNRLEDEPQFNPVKQLAFDISRQLEAGDLTRRHIAELVKALSDQALLHRARDMRSYISSKDQQSALDDPDIQNQLKVFFKSLAFENGNLTEGEKCSFEQFQAKLAKAFCGVVFTAHPTFLMSTEMRKMLVSLIETPELNLTGLSSDLVRGEIRDLKELDHVPDARLTLRYEHDQAQTAIEHAASARNKIFQLLSDITEQLYPQDWHKLEAELIAIHSWVGYDLDGRTDIQWHDTVKCRLQEKLRALQNHKTKIQVALDELCSDLAEKTERSKDANPVPPLNQAVKYIDDEISFLNACLPLFQRDLESPERLSRAANFLTTKKDRALATSITPLIEMINQSLSALVEPGEGRQASTDIQKKMALLRNEIKACGLGTARIHMRINAMQLHNAIRKPLGAIERVDVTSRVALSQLDHLIIETGQETVNFVSLALEPATAIRQFIAIAQILKHVDNDKPIRLLIAECEQSFTVLSALYFANLFGIEDKIDISPLFETERALERGAQVIETLLEYKSYRAYIRKRGRLCIQTGFSDAGRFMGQIPAGLAVEQLQQRIAGVVKEAGFENIEVLIFNTHGESMGRGAHPGNLVSRFDYVLSPKVRSIFAQSGTRLHPEVSFQGGDGYVCFGSSRLALATMSQYLLHAGCAPVMEKDDYYLDSDFTEDLFERVRNYQTRLFENPHYQRTLGCFGTNLLFQTGSRKSKRQFDSRNDGRSSISQMRAIPHNALLQQFGFLANVVSGFGVVLRRDRHRFNQLYQNSRRIKEVIAMVFEARRLSSIKNLVAYASLFDDAFWVTRPIENMESPLREPSLNLATLLRGDPRHDSLMHLATLLREDDIYLHDLYLHLGGASKQIEIGAHTQEQQLELDILHALRIALIMHIYLLAARLPRLADRNDISHKDIMEMVLSLQIEEAAGLLKEAYPRVLPEMSDYALQEQASYQGQKSTDFEELNNGLIDPMLEAYEIVLRIGVGLSHHYRAHG